jgi:hypothetical protein
MSNRGSVYAFDRPGQGLNARGICPNRLPAPQPRSVAGLRIDELIWHREATPPGLPPD